MTLSKIEILVIIAVSFNMFAIFVNILGMVYGNDDNSTIGKPLPYPEGYYKDGYPIIENEVIQPEEKVTNTKGYWIEILNEYDDDNGEKADYWKCVYVFERVGDLISYYTNHSLYFDVNATNDEYYCIDWSSHIPK